MDYFNLNNLNPYMRIAWHYFDFPMGRINGPRLSFDYEVMHVNFGHVVITIGDIDYSFGPGEFIFIPPNILHTVSFPDMDSNYAYLHFDIIYSPQSHIRPTSVKQINLYKADTRLIHENVLEGLYKQPSLHFENMEAAKKIYFGITKDNALNSRSAKDNIEEKRLLLQFFNMLLKDNYPEFFSRCTQPGLPIATAIKNYIDEGHYEDSLADLEYIFSFNRFHIERQFKKKYKMSLMAYKNLRRLETAHLLLQKNPVGKVAEQLGYSSVYAFSRAFKNRYGFSPSEAKNKK